ncbi:hypothetical protein AMTRI_Chr10g230390 [Amborella trichopoda]
MALVVLYLNSISISCSRHLSTDSNLWNEKITLRINDRRSSCMVFSSHSNPRMLKPNRRSRFGKQLPTCDDEEPLLSDEESMEMEEIKDDSFIGAKPLGFASKNDAKRLQGIYKSLRKLQEGKTAKIARESNSPYPSQEIKYVQKAQGKVNSSYAGQAKEQLQDQGSMEGTRDQEKVKTGKFTESRIRQMSEELDLDEKWFPLIEYLSTFGLKESHFTQIYERHMPSLQINLEAARERMDFLLSLGVKQRDIKKIILRQPQILEYTVENNLKSHVQFLLSLGVPHSKLGRIISAAPSLFSYSVEQSLKPTVRYLVEEVGIKATDVGKVVQLSPQILVQRIDDSWTSRMSFLSRELGAPRESIVKMVKKHPQLLHYSIEDGILPRINFLRSIGMRDSDVLKILTGLTQVLSLSLENNLRPKYLYLIHELRNEVQSLTKYPTYFSLSLEQRIRPRHKFLVSLKKAPKGPFPLSSLVLTDECFCQQWAGTSLQKYQAFRQNMMISDFAEKFQRTC